MIEGKQIKNTYIYTDGENKARTIDNSRKKIRLFQERGFRYWNLKANILDGIFYFDDRTFLPYKRLTNVPAYINPFSKQLSNR